MADADPYLAFAAALASSVDGIANQIEPPPEFDDDLHPLSAAPALPPRWRRRTGCFEEC